MVIRRSEYGCHFDWALGASLYVIYGFGKRRGRVSLPEGTFVYEDDGTVFDMVTGTMYYPA